MDLRQRAFHWPLAERRASPTLPLSHEDPRSLRWRCCRMEQAALGEAGSTEGGVQATRPITHLPQQLSIPGAAVIGGRDTPTNCSAVGHAPAVPRATLGCILLKHPCPGLRKVCPHVSVFLLPQEIAVLEKTPCRLFSVQHWTGACALLFSYFFSPFSFFLKNFLQKYS